MKRIERCGLAAPAAQEIPYHLSHWGMNEDDPPIQRGEYGYMRIYKDPDTGRVRYGGGVFFVNL